MGPHRPDIIIIEEAGIPRAPVGHKAIPLDAERVAGADVLGQFAKHEARIFLARTETADLPPLDPPDTSGRRLITEQQHLTEACLMHRRSKRLESCLNRNARDRDERHAGKSCKRRSIAQAGSFETPVRETYAMTKQTDCPSGCAKTMRGASRPSRSPE